MNRLVAWLLFAGPLACAADPKPAAQDLGPPDLGAQETRDLSTPTTDASAPDAEPRDADERDLGTTNTSSLSAARDRLLFSEAERRGQTTCERWMNMSPAERGVFLTITDLLGKRTRLANGDLAIEHTLKLWAVRDAQTSGCVRCCGGGEYNRLYLSADDALIAAFRNPDAEISPWKSSTDPAGPHAPFGESAMTEGGLPEGQAHYFSIDADVVPLEREGVEGVLDPHVVEIDIDYNFIHDSNPSCTYGGVSGLDLYEQSFSAVGALGSAELDYVPSGCP